MPASSGKWLRYCSASRSETATTASGAAEQRPLDEAGLQPRVVVGSGLQGEHDRRATAGEHDSEPRVEVGQEGVGLDDVVVALAEETARAVDAPQAVTDREPRGDVDVVGAVGRVLVAGSSATMSTSWPARRMRSLRSSAIVSAPP